MRLSLRLYAAATADGFRTASRSGLMSAWQCLSFVQPGSQDFTSELHRTSTKRIPAINRPDHLLIRVEAASLNPVDLLGLYGYGSRTFWLTGLFGSRLGLLGTHSPNGFDHPSFPWIPGRDFAGTLVRTGPSASNGCCESHTFKLHDRIAGATWPFLSTSGSGSLSEYILCPASYAAVIPDNVGSVEATSIGYAGLTAWSALETGGLTLRTKSPFSSPVVLIAGATGGVGLIAAQLAKLWGARVHVTCPADDASQKIMKELDVEEVVTFPDRPPYGMKYDLIVNCIRPPSLSKLQFSADSITPGTVAQFALPSVPDLFEYLKPDLSARFVNLNSPIILLTDKFGPLFGPGMAVAQLVGSQLLAWSPGSGSGCGQLRWAFFKPDGKRLARMLHWVSTGELKTYIDSVLSFDQVPEAFTRLKTRGVRGKVCIKLPS